MPDGANVIVHDRSVFARAVDPLLQIKELDEDPRIQIYRTSLDAFLSWLSLVASALDRKLFQVADIQDVGYWVAKIESELVLHPFIIGFGYKGNIEKLIRLYRGKESAYRNWVFPVNPPPKTRERLSSGGIQAWITMGSRLHRLPFCQPKFLLASMMSSASCQPHTGSRSSELIR